MTKISDRFKRIIPVLLDHEGGFVDHPSDPGGATNMGITIKTLSSHLGRPATKEEVRALTKEQAMQIYHKRYWMPWLDELETDALAGIVFNQGVLNGTTTVTLALQKVIRAIPTGTFDQASMKRLKAYGEVRAAFDLIQAMSDRYADIVKRKPSSIVFIKGWMRRLFGLIKTYLRPR